MTEKELNDIEVRANFHSHIHSATVLRMVRDMRESNEWQARAEKAEAQLAAAREGKLYEVIDTGEHTIAHPGFYVLPMQIRAGRYLTQKATLEAAAALCDGR